MVNRLRIHDAPLGGEMANRAARIGAGLAVSVADAPVADAHAAAVLATTVGPHAVLTSDVVDLDRVAEHLGIELNVVRI